MGIGAAIGSVVSSIGGAGVASIASSAVGALASQKGAKVQAQAASEANAIQREQYEQTRSDLAPYRDAGQAGLDAYMQQLGFTASSQPPPAGANGGTATNTTTDPMAHLRPQNLLGLPEEAYQRSLRGGHPEKTGDPFGGPLSTGQSPQGGSGAPTGTNYTYNAPELPDLGLKALSQGFTESPGYQFQLDEGMRAVQNSASARGMVNSGRTLKDLTRFGQGLANQDYWNYVSNNRQGVADNYSLKESSLDRLRDLSNTGQNSSAQQATANQNFASAYGANLARGAAATASGYAGVANSVNSGLNNYLSYKNYQNVLGS